MTALSKKALDMLEYNGYTLKQSENQFVFKHSATDAIGLSIILLITALCVIALMVFNPLIGAGSLLVSLLIFAPIVKRSKGRSHLLIDLEREFVKIEDRDTNSTISLAEISGVYAHSKFVDEYTSAFKSTSKEYRITIGLEIDRTQIPLFKLIADHAKPSKEMNEVYDFLESILLKNRDLHHS